MVLKPTRGFDSWQAIDDFHIGPFSVYKQTFGVAAQFQMARWGMTPQFGRLLHSMVVSGNPIKGGR